MIESAENNGNPLELILCIMPQQDNKHLYATGYVSWSLVFGPSVAWQIMSKKCKPKYIANVIVKINEK